MCSSVQDAFQKFVYTDTHTHTHKMLFLHFSFYSKFVLLFFRYPLKTTVPPATDQSASGSEVEAELSQPESNEIDPFDLFPPQFHELLEIPLHTYTNGSSYNPHKRQQSRPLGPFISKGYASTKFQGGNRFRPQSSSDTPQVAYRPKPVFNDKPNQSVTRTRRPSTPSSLETVTLVSRPSSSTTKAPTTRIHKATMPPRRKVYVSPPSRIPPSPTRLEDPPTTTHQVITAQSETSTLSKSTTSKGTYAPEPSLSKPYDRKDSEGQDYHLRIPDNLPPLRYTRRTTTEFPTSSYFTTPKPTTSSPKMPIISADTEKNSYVSTTEQPLPIQKGRVPLYGTRIPSRASSIKTTTPNSLSPILVEHLKPKPLDNQKPTQHSPSVTAPEEKIEEVFRPSKTDPFLRPRLPTTTIPSLSEERHNYHQEIPEVLPPVVNTYEVTEKSSTESDFSTKPAPPSISASPLPSQSSSMPPPPKPPSRPFLPPPPLPAERRPLPPPWQPATISQFSSRPSSMPPTPPLRGNRPILAPPPPLPPRVDRPSLAPPPLPPPREFFDNEILPPFPPAPLPHTPSSYSRPPIERPAHPPLSFGPPSRQSNIHRPRPRPTQFPTSNKPQRIARPRPQSRPSSSRPQVHPPFQIIHPVITPPPVPQNIPDQPEPGFALPVEAGNLPKRPFQNGELPSYQLENNAPNILPQFRPNAPRQHETFGFQEPSERVFNTRPRPMRPDKRPVLSKRPSFLENFNFFRRTPINRRRGVTGPRTDINNSQQKVTKNQNLIDKTTAIHYQLTHGPLPKHAQKVVVIGPFKEPPPGAPIIPVPKNDNASPVNLPQDLPRPPPPAPPSRKVSPPPISFQQNMSQESHVSKKGHFDEAEDRIGSEQLFSPTDNKHNFRGTLTPQNREGVKEMSDVIYGQPLSFKSERVSAPGADQLQNNPPVARPESNKMEEVSEEHKEAIIAGKFRFPPLSVDRSGAGNDNAFPQNVIPMPVPLLTPQQDSPVKWSVFGFGSPSKSKPPSSEYVITQPPRVQRPPLPPPPHKVNGLRAPPPLPPNLQHLHNKVHPNKSNSRRPVPSRYNQPISYDLPPTPARFVDFHQKNLTEDVPNTNVTTSPPMTTTSTTVPPSTVISTFIPFSVSAVTAKSTKPRPVYRPTVTTTEEQTTTVKTDISTPAVNIQNVTSPPLVQISTTSQPVTPMRITEFNPYNEYYRASVRDDSRGATEGGFKAPVIKSSDYSGWKVVGAPRLPSTGPGDGLSPVISYVKENIPDILIAPIRKSMDRNIDGDIVTGVISDRMGEVDDDSDSQLVKYSSQFNVETPGIVRSYWVKPPSLV